MSVKRKLLLIYNKLLKHYGPRNWWPADSSLEIIFGAILVQNVSWKNAKIAIDNLKEHNMMSAEGIINADLELISDIIKPSRFYNQKAKKLKSFCSFLIDNYNNSLRKMFLNDVGSLRMELLNIYGIGKETADSILLYAGEKLSFVSDNYTNKFLNRYRFTDNLNTYEDVRIFFMDNLPKDIYLYNEYHALIVHHCYHTCKTVPDCYNCTVGFISEDCYCKFKRKIKNI